MPANPIAAIPSKAATIRCGATSSDNTRASTPAAAIPDSAVNWAGLPAIGCPMIARMVSGVDSSMLVASRS